MKILVVYYSWQGHTEKVAEELASRLKAQTVKVEAVKESGMAKKGIKAALGFKSDIKPCKADLDDIDYLVIATPVWAGRPTPYINKYISMITNYSGKPFSVLAEMRRSGADKTIAQIRKVLENKGMKFISSTYTLEEDVEAGKFHETVSEFARTIKDV
jgi:flavodoxin